MVSRELTVVHEGFLAVQLAICTPFEPDIAESIAGLEQGRNGAQGPGEHFLEEGIRSCVFCEPPEGEARGENLDERNDRCAAREFFDKNTNIDERAGAPAELFREGKSQPALLADRRPQGFVPALRAVDFADAVERELLFEILADGLLEQGLCLGQVQIHGVLLSVEVRGQRLR
jgi:hypothetical protein